MFNFIVKLSIINYIKDRKAHAARYSKSMSRTRMPLRAVCGNRFILSVIPLSLVKETINKAVAKYFQLKITYDIGNFIISMTAAQLIIRHGLQARAALAGSRSEWQGYHTGKVQTDPSRALAVHRGIGKAGKHRSDNGKYRPTRRRALSSRHEVHLTASNSGL